MKSLRKQAGFFGLFGFLGIDPISVVVVFALFVAGVYFAVKGIAWTLSPTPEQAARTETFAKAADTALFAAPKDLQSVQCFVPKNGQQTCRYATFDGLKAHVRRSTLDVPTGSTAFAFNWAIGDSTSDLSVDKTVANPGEANVKQYLTRVLKASPQ